MIFGFVDVVQLKVLVGIWERHCMEVISPEQMTGLDGVKDTSGSGKIDTVKSVVGPKHPLAAGIM